MARTPQHIAIASQIVRHPFTYKADSADGDLWQEHDLAVRNLKSKHKLLLSCITEGVARSENEQTTVPESRFLLNFPKSKPISLLQNYHMSP